ncbi:MAG: hypothetical protein CMK59_10785 [Proteobacteria bacterium]|nr:hypothetical protein [Pseudomonadota bacterium]
MSLNRLFSIPIDSFILSGEDVQRWCNGMFTNNIRSMKPLEVKRTAYCNDRGHVQGIAMIQCIDREHFQVICDGTSYEQFNERFKMFMMLDDIEISASNTQILTIQGSSSTQILENANFPIPEDGFFSNWEGVSIYKRDRSGLGGWDIVGKDLDQAKLLLLQSGAQTGEETELEQLRILAGFPKWPQDATEKTFLHELGLNTACCAFDKGCYVGQEIINRMDIKQIFNRKLLRVKMSAPVPVNSRFFVAEARKKPDGLLTSSTTKEDVHYGLALIRKKNWEPGTVLNVYPPEGTEGAVIAKATVLEH